MVLFVLYLLLIGFRVSFMDSVNFFPGPNEESYQTFLQKCADIASPHEFCKDDQGNKSKLYVIGKIVEAVDDKKLTNDKAMQYIDEVRMYNELSSNKGINNMKIMEHVEWPSTEENKGTNPEMIWEKLVQKECSNYDQPFKALLSTI